MTLKKTSLVKQENYHCPRCEKFSQSSGHDGHKLDYMHSMCALDWRFDPYCTCSYCELVKFGFTITAHTMVLYMCCLDLGLDFTFKEDGFWFENVEAGIKSPLFPALPYSLSSEGILGFHNARQWLRGNKEKCSTALHTARMRL